MSSIVSDGSPSHVLLFPFMSKGHTIPLLHLATTLLRRSISVTVVTTPANRPFIAGFLTGTAASVATLPFPAAANIPSGVESTDKLPSMSLPLFYEFATATSSMQPHFEHLLETLPRVSFMLTDFFLWWTVHSAKRFGIPRFAVSGMSCYSSSVSIEAIRSGILTGSQPDDELVALTRFPWIRLSKEDFDPEFRNFDPSTLGSVFHREVLSAVSGSHCVLVNSFYELEPTFVDYVNAASSPKSFCIGPLCLTEWAPKVYSEARAKPRWVTWLDQKLEEKCSVLYVAFGSQAEVSREQVGEMGRGLEESKVSFLWVMRKEEWGVGGGFEERVKGRGMVVREWVDQREILMHESVGGFVSHCGWNSVLESVCAGVPIVAWPVMAEQYLNARMVEEEMKVGLRVERCDGSVRGFVKWEGLQKAVKEVMEGDKGKKAREKVRELAEMAKMATQQGGSSWSTLDSILSQTCGQN
ncbi:UDP-glycosyltransferase 90A1 [Cajanus cajan]|uniref:Glycosyltransferase n=1 Tax=Cajanus cajan TaxID=3821 RepID=A0A151QPF5_CAJCA|nr:UDP-glycosyltransferase 90A1 [Cajanus cajan]KYP32190.1 Cytokinin-O-glucosyltransferase 3 [Cajanus cajan]